MEIHGQILQFAGSLAAILVLALVARWLGLGASPRLDSEERAREAASEAVDGFEAADVALDRSGHAALVRDREGRIMVLKLHGNRYAARLLGQGSVLEAVEGGILVRSGEKRFGDVMLELERAPAWAPARNTVEAA